MRALEWWSPCASTASRSTLLLGLTNLNLVYAVVWNVLVALGLLHMRKSQGRLIAGARSDLENPVLALVNGLV